MWRGSSIRFYLFLLLLCASMLSHTRAEFQQISFLPKTSDFNGVSNILRVGTDKLAFSYDGGIYVADGTPSGTVKVVDHVTGDYIVNQYWTRVFYLNGSDFHYYDIDSAKDTTVYSMSPYYGSIVSSFDGKILALWRTPDCYQLMAYTINGGYQWVEDCIPDAPEPTPLDLCVFNSWAIYHRYKLGAPEASEIHYAPDSRNCYFDRERPESGRELWRAYLRSGEHGVIVSEDRFVGDLNPGPASSNPRFYCNAAGGLLFFATPSEDQSLHSLYFTIGDSVVRIRDFNMNPWTQVSIVSIGSRAVFIVPECNGTYLWSTDGTSAGTFRLMEVTDTQLVSAESWAFFVSKTPEHGIELYQTDGTPSPGGTFRVPFETVTGPGSSSPFGLTAFGSDLYFNAYTNGGRTIEVFKYPPSYLLPAKMTRVFDRKSGWLTPNGNETMWGSGGTCGIEIQPAPMNYPEFPNTTVDGLIDSAVYHLQSTSNNFGCGPSYPAPYLNFRRSPTGASLKQLRFWFKSTVATKLEIEVAGPCAPFTVVKGQDPCRLYRHVASTDGEWKSMNLVLGDRPAKEFATVVSPLLVTLKAPGEATVANIVLVAA